MDKNPRIIEGAHERPPATVLELQATFAGGFGQSLHLPVEKEAATIEVDVVLQHKREWLAAFCYSLPDGNMRERDGHLLPGHLNALRSVVLVLFEKRVWFHEQLVSQRVVGLEFLSIRRP